MSNAETILLKLDKYLAGPVELTLYGRAALQMGFIDPPAEYAQSMDVDGVLWLGQAEALIKTGNFWEAVDCTNKELAPRGLYISHFFEESQLILTPDWRQCRVPLPGTWRSLRLARLSDRDLFLSKLMRYDPQDMEDALFILDRSGMSRADAAELIAQARVPDIPELREQFALCSKRFVETRQQGI